MTEVLVQFVNQVEILLVTVFAYSTIISMIVMELAKFVKPHA